MCAREGSANSIECGFNYCINNSTGMCTKIENQIYGKDKITNKCIYNVNEGATTV